MADKDQRAERLKAQLRANLRRRKAPVDGDPAGTDERRTAIDPDPAALDVAD